MSTGIHRIPFQPPQSLSPTPLPQWAPPAQCCSIIQCPRHQTWVASPPKWCTRLTAAGELQRCAFASRLSVLPGSHPAHNVSTMPGNKERALVSHAIAAMQSLYTLEMSICPTFVCGCPLLKTYCLIPVPFTTSRYFDPQQYLSVKGYFVWGTHTCQSLWTYNVLNLLVPFQPCFCRPDKNCNAFSRAFLTSRSCVTSMSIIQQESALHI